MQWTQRESENIYKSCMYLRDFYPEYIKHNSTIKITNNPLKNGQKI